ncbi:TIGR02301 family protein [Tepidamorphus sp. 3E244]|uniref:TIGR02301 family protein n=1 Tax=Tepidamorphus sp. 3E244 TaxID=3385498 RepID=UPI0038FCDCA1
MFQTTTRTKALAAFALAAALMAGAAPASAQSEASIRPGLKEQTAPYDDQMARLSELLGAIHYLRNLCGAEDGKKWRDLMQALLEAENPSVGRRARFTDGFNRGYRGYERTHSECTDASKLLADRFVREGTRISNQIATRYGN